ncbi:hypothetical protein PR202_ga15512 [Eleusine coracana subsp. coracana]|uniref:Protein kinase domain-containing protein n=1 Tax=Eleusine coracana subsp. coracana TaxID=191504 RepID=A0AAV5CJK8_ELECO|nr:hypothetical protein PR202_ga15512 [Eleusine coracana subsp. coracana]
MPELTKLYLGRNRLTGGIPPELGACAKLQLLDLGGNGFSGAIPPELGELPSLEIARSTSAATGSPATSRRAVGDTRAPLAALQNLVTLNVSYNGFSGDLPDTPFFQKLPLSDLAGNRHLVVGDGSSRHGGARSPRSRSPCQCCSPCSARSSWRRRHTCWPAPTAIIPAPAGERWSHGEGGPWEVTLYQKLDIAMDDVLRELTSSNVIGTGSSGVVYRVETPNGYTFAVKKMWSASDETFRSEIAALGSIRHRNIVRLLGWAANGGTRLLFYTYLPNGSLSGLLHGGGGSGKGSANDEWAARYHVALGVAHAVAYLHHDCVPAILHGDIKAMNVLLGPAYEPYLADFGLARVLSSASPKQQLDDTIRQPRIAGSYGYIAPEYASMQRISEKSDVYSFGVVVLEILTGRHPLDPTLPGGAHLVQWVRAHLQATRDAAELLDPRLTAPGAAAADVQEMRQVLSVAALCVAHRADDRPAMTDVVALLKEIRRPAAARRRDDATKTHSQPAPTQPVSPVRSPHSRDHSSSCSFA